MSNPNLLFKKKNEYKCSRKFFTHPIFLYKILYKITLKLLGLSMKYVTCFQLGIFDVIVIESK